MKIEYVVECAKKYWALRDAGAVGEQRTLAHNRLMDTLDDIGICYQDREEAARMGLELTWLVTLNTILHYAALHNNPLADSWMKIAVYARSVGQQLQVADFLSIDLTVAPSVSKTSGKGLVKSMIAQPFLIPEVVS